jgi:hypothetical protein
MQKESFFNMDLSLIDRERFSATTSTGFEGFIKLFFILFSNRLRE